MTYEGWKDKRHLCRICNVWVDRGHFRKEHGITVKQNKEMKTYIE